MRLDLELPDWISNGARRRIAVDTNGPTFDGGHSLVQRLRDIVSRPYTEIPPGGKSNPVDWTGLEGVLTALIEADARFGPGGTLHALLPSALRRAKPREITHNYPLTHEDGTPIVY